MSPSAQTSSGNNNCLLHSIIPHLIWQEQLCENVVSDQAFLDKIRDYYGLAYDMTPERFRYLFRHHFQSRQDQELILGPVMRAFLYDQMLEAFNQWREANNKTDFVGEDINYDNLPTFSKGFVNSYIMGSLDADHISSFSQYLQQVIRGARYLDGLDSCLLQEDWNFHWGYISAEVQSRLDKVANQLSQVKDNLQNTIYFDLITQELDSQLSSQIEQIIESSVSIIDQARCTGINESTFQSLYEKFSELGNYSDVFDANKIQQLNNLLRDCHTNYHLDDETFEKQELQRNIEICWNNLHQEAQNLNRDAVICSYLNYNHFEFIPPLGEHAQEYEQVESQLASDTTYDDITLIKEQLDNALASPRPSCDRSNQDYANESQEDTDSDGFETCYSNLDGDSKATDSDSETSSYADDDFDFQTCYEGSDTDSVDSDDQFRSQHSFYEQCSQEHSDAGESYTATPLSDAVMPYQHNSANYRFFADVPYVDEAAIINQARLLFAHFLSLEIVIRGSFESTSNAEAESINYTLLHRWQGFYSEWLIGNTRHQSLSELLNDTSIFLHRSSTGISIEDSANELGSSQMVAYNTAAMFSDHNTATTNQPSSIEDQLVSIESPRGHN